MRRAIPLMLVALAVALLASPPSIADATCRTSGPTSGAFDVTVCVGGDLDTSPLIGDEAVPITATATNGRLVKQVEVFLSNQYLLTDYEAPWSFVLPTDRFVDRSYRLQVQAVISGDPEYTSPRTIVDVTFDNGVTVPPVNNKTFDPPDPDGGAVVAAAVGDGASGETGSDAVAGLVTSWNPELFFYLGDVYRDGTGTEFRNWYGPQAQRFGALRSVTAPTIGNHEYQGNSGGAGYFFYWDNVPHYYSFDAGPWHVVVLDANPAFGQLGTSSPQYAWLRQDLLDAGEDCVLATYHQPRFSVGRYAPGTSSLQPIWSLLASNGVDLVLSAHDHNYQRWKPMGPSGSFDPDGTRQFVVGTGGHEQYGFFDTDSRVVRRYTNIEGALRLELRSGQAAFSFQRSDGIELDAGSFDCSPLIDRQPPTKVPNLNASAVDAYTVDLAWDPASDNVGVDRYRIFRDNSLLSSVV
jgi:hypothetical protein